MRRNFKLLAATAAATGVGSLLFVLAPAEAGQRELTCVDFPFQEIAQDQLAVEESNRQFDTRTETAKNLDADYDGLACEELPRSPTRPPGIPAPTPGTPTQAG